MNGRERNEKKENRERAMPLSARFLSRTNYNVVVVVVLTALNCATAIVSVRGSDGSTENNDETRTIMNKIYEQQERAFATEEEKGDNWSGFVQSVLVMLSLEFGDRTFFIASLLASKYDPREVFIGAVLALWSMTAVSVLIGIEAAAVIPRAYVHYGSILLFLFYAFWMLWSAKDMVDKPSEELKEVEDELNSRDEENTKLVNNNSRAEKGSSSMSRDDDDNNNSKNSTKRGFMKCLFGGIWVQSFVMTFVAEWGDRSQIATIALAGDYKPLGIMVGVFLGHAIATGTACVGGKYLASKLSEKKMAIIGGSVFLIFAILTLVQDPDTELAKKVDWNQWRPKFLLFLDEE
jgi:Ca2+/H+ antiporter, TMEM165/GDT1 family